MNTLWKKHFLTHYSLLAKKDIDNSNVLVPGVINFGLVKMYQEDFSDIDGHWKNREVWVRFLLYVPRRMVKHQSFLYLFSFDKKIVLVSLPHGRWQRRYVRRIWVC